MLNQICRLAEGSLRSQVNSVNTPIGTKTKEWSMVKIIWECLHIPATMYNSRNFTGTLFCDTVLIFNSRVEDRVRRRFSRLAEGSQVISTNTLDIGTKTQEWIKIKTILECLHIPVTMYNSRHFICTLLWHDLNFLILGWRIGSVVGLLGWRKGTKSSARTR